MLTMKQPHTALFVAPMGVGKTHLALDLLEQEYFNHFNLIVIICTILGHNATNRSQKWFRTDPCIIHIEPGNRLYNCIKAIGNILAESKTLFLIDDITGDENLNKRRQPLPELTI